MLLRLIVNDVVLIDTLELAFEPGLTVFTGETGAGKSILLDALGLALGMRGDASLIRQGCAQAVVIAEFLPSDTRLQKELAAADISCHETLILRRIVSSTGPSRAYINDQLVNVGFLKTLSPYLLEIHGQFDRLLSSTSHRQALDAFGQLETSSVRLFYNQWRDLEDRYQDCCAKSEALKHEVAFLQDQVAEISALNPQPNEETQLLDVRRKLIQQDRIQEALTQSIQSLSGPAGALTLLHTSEKTMARFQDLLPVETEQAHAALMRGIIEVTEAQELLVRQQRDLQMERWDLEAVDDRLQALRTAARKYGTVPENLRDQLDQAQQTLARLSSLDSEVATLRQEKEKVQHAYEEAARALHNQRLSAKELLTQSINQELPALKLEKAQFHVNLTELPVEKGTEDGIDDVEFLVATNPENPPGTFAKVASGGELSRLMLALKVVLAQQNKLYTLIFDEIDQGTGGAVAAAIGERLVRLAQGSQVLVITHSPQVAACASQHILVSKTQERGRMVTRAVSLTPEERREELARMLSGQEITHEARAAAERLLRKTGS